MRQSLQATSAQAANLFPWPHEFSGEWSQALVRGAAWGAQLPDLSALLGAEHLGCGNGRPSGTAAGVTMVQVMERQGKDSFEAGTCTICGCAEQGVPALIRSVS